MHFIFQLLTTTVPKSVPPTRVHLRLCIRLEHAQVRRESGTRNWGGHQILKKVIKLTSLAVWWMIDGMPEETCKMCKYVCSLMNGCLWQIRLPLCKELILNNQWFHLTKTIMDMTNNLRCQFNLNLDAVLTVNAYTTYCIIQYNLYYISGSYCNLFYSFIVENTENYPFFKRKCIEHCFVRERS